MRLTTLLASLLGTVSLFFLATSAAFAQHQPATPVQPNVQNPAYVFGKIMDSATGKPIAGASIRIRNGRAGTLSSDSGNFVLPATGRIVAIVSVNGFADKEVVLIPGPTPCNVLLRNQEKELGEVVVVG